MFFNTSTVVKFKRRRILVLVITSLPLVLVLWFFYELLLLVPSNPVPKFEVALLASFSDKTEAHNALCQTLKQLPEIAEDSDSNSERRTISKLLQEYNSTEEGEVFQQLFQHCNIITYNANPKSHQKKPPTIFAITPTYKRLSQKVDLTSLCQTLMNIPDLIWIVVEDSKETTDLVTALLKRCRVNSIHLNIYHLLRNRWSESKGIAQRNYGLLWIRIYCMLVLKSRPCQGVVYFMDDDNKYDLRLFEEIRKTKQVSVFPVAFVGGLKIEGPVCQNEKITDWRVVWIPSRLVPIDMAGFAINVRDILQKPTVWMGYKQSKTSILKGEVESCFLEYFVEDQSQLECRGSETEVYVWHVKTENPSLHDEPHWKGRTRGDFLQY